MNNKMLAEMIDGGITDISSDFSYSRGCETCDYGSSYCSEYTIYLSDNSYIRVSASQMYDYHLSDGHMIKTIVWNLDEIKAMSINDLESWLETTLKDVGAKVEISRYRGR